VSDLPEKMTQTAVAAHLGVGRATVRRWTRAGILPVVTDPESGQPCYMRTSIAAWSRRAGELAAERSAS